MTLTREEAADATDQAITNKIQEMEAVPGMTGRLLERIIDRLLDSRESVIESLMQPRKVYVYDSETNTLQAFLQ